MLLKSKQGIAAGYRQEELGHVLFVNLPLGYLASRTDGLLLHSFLHFFAFRMANFNLTGFPTYFRKNNRLMDVHKHS